MSKIPESRELFSIIKYDDMIDFKVNTLDKLLSPNEFEQVLQQTFNALCHLSNLGIDKNIIETIFKITSK